MGGVEKPESYVDSQENLFATIAFKVSTIGRARVAQAQPLVRTNNECYRPVEYRILGGL